MPNTTSKPWYIYVSLLRAKSYRSIENGFGDLSDAIDKDIITAAECIWEDDAQTLDNVIRTAFDSLANCFGQPKSSNYDDNGNYKVR